MTPPRTLAELKRHLHRLRRAADRLARRCGIPPGPAQLAAAIDALPDRRILVTLPQAYRTTIERELGAIGLPEVAAPE